MLKTADEITKLNRNLPNSQETLEAYINASDFYDKDLREELSAVLRNLVHKSVLKREVSDLEDFEEDCVVAIWSKITAIKIGDNVNRIDNLEAFVRQAVHNRYCDAIRRKRPKWYNLKLELLEIFSGRANIKGFALWQNPSSGERMCGFEKWNGSSKNSSSTCREMLEKTSDFRNKVLDNKDPRELPTYALAASVLNYCDGPVNIDLLTNSITELTQAKIPEPMSLDTQPDENSDNGSPIDYLIAPGENVEKQIVDSAWFSHVIDWFWNEFTVLSIRQKKAILYGLSGDQVMALCSAVGMKKVAEALEITSVHLASIINKLPLPDALTAEELKIQARAIPSIRFKAWGRIRRRTKKTDVFDDDI